MPDEFKRTEFGTFVPGTKPGPGRGRKTYLNEMLYLQAAQETVNLEKFQIMIMRAWPDACGFVLDSKGKIKKDENGNPEIAEDSTPMTRTAARNSIMPHFLPKVGADIVIQGAEGELTNILRQLGNSQLQDIMSQANDLIENLKKTRKTKEEKG